MWIGSVEGLNRFDGRRVTVFRPDMHDSTGMLGRNVQSQFFEDGEGDIWFSTEEGLNCYRWRTGRMEPHWIVHGGISRKRTIHQAIFLERGRYLWVVCEGKLYLIDTKGPSPAHEAEFLSDLGAMRFHVQADEKGRVRKLLGCYWDNPPKGYEIIEFDPDHKVLSHEQHLGPIQDTTFLDGLITEDGTILLGTSHGLVVREPGKSQATYSFLPNAYHKAILPLSASTFLLMIEDRRIVLFDLPTRTFTTIVDGEENLGGGMYLSPEGVLWYGKRGTGAAYRQIAPLFVTHPAPDTSGGLVAYSLASSGANELWASSRGEVWRVSASGTWQKTGNRRIPRQKPSRSGEMWEISREGLGVYANDSDGAFSLIQERGMSIYYDLSLSPTACFIASSSGPLVCDLATRTARPLKMPGPDSYLLAIHCDGRERIWTGSGQGIALWAHAPGDSLELIRGFPQTGIVNHFLEDPGRNLIWVATASGLYSIHLTTLEMIWWTAERGLPAAYSYSLVLDRESMLWIATNRGVYRLNPELGTSRHFARDRGVINREFLPKSAALDGSGQVWFGGLDGIDRFRVDGAEKVGRPPRLAMVGVYVNGQELNLEGQSVESLAFLDLQHDQNMIRFDMAAMEYLDPENNHFRVRLLGQDSIWRDLGVTNTVTYSNLNPGEYTFQFTASNSEDLWQEEVKSLSFVIHPHFTQTIWFRAMLILAALALVAAGTAGYYRYQLNQQALAAEKKLREAEKEQLELQNELNLKAQREQISHNIHDDLGVGLARIGLLGDDGLNGTNDSSLTSLFSKITELAKELDDNRRALSWATDPELDYLSSLLARVRKETVELCVARGIRYEIDFPILQEDIPLSGAIRLEVLRISKELINNVIRHARAESVILRCWLEDQHLHLTLTDDGVGFEANEQETGIGLRSVQKRAKSIHAAIEWQRAEPQGTKVTLDVPLATG